MEKKSKIDDPPASTADPTAIAASSISKNWSDLPQDLLISIIHRLSLSILDLFAVSSVCRSWRSASSAASTRFCGPPLLLTPITSPYRRWSDPPQCRLQTLTLTTNNPARPYRSMISSETLKKRCLGYSHGQLIFVGRKNAFIADVFTGRQIQPPDFPSPDRRFASGILTAPVNFSSCLLLLVSFNVVANNFSDIMCWRLGSSDWSKLELKMAVTRGIINLGVIKGQIFAMDSLYHLTVVEFVPRVGWNPSGVMRPGGDKLMSNLYYPDHYLVECDGELLFVAFIPRRKIEVYRLDSSQSVWVEMESLGDWCLFIDMGRKFGFSCRNPTRWGGRDNCIYLARPGMDNWTVIPLDGGAFNTGRRSPSPALHSKVFEWPSPIWVYPSMLL